MKYFDLNNYELVTKYKNLINGMNSFTSESKIKYKEGWERRCKDKIDLELVLYDRNIDIDFILNNNLSEHDCNTIATFWNIVFNYNKIIWLSKL